MFSPLTRPVSLTCRRSSPLSGALLRSTKMCRRRSNLTSYPSKRGGRWRPAVFTLMVGGVSYSLSGFYLAHKTLTFPQWLMNLYGQDKDSWISEMRRWWWELGANNRFIGAIIGTNLAVLAAWRLPGLNIFMNRYFTTGIRNRGTLHLLLASFSHMDVWHFALNMIAFSSFAGAAMNLLGDSASAANMLPYYLTAGTFASTVGYYNRLYRGSRIASLGASGALMAVAGLVIMAEPDAKVALIFLPFYPIKAGTVLSGVVLLDVVGLIRGWKFFDHAGHLGGVFFAFLYGMWLHKVCSTVQKNAANFWTRLNSKQ